MKYVRFWMISEQKRFSPFDPLPEIRTTLSQLRGSGKYGKKSVNGVIHLSNEFFIYIYFFFLVSLRAKSGSQYYKIVFLRGKTATLVSALRRNDHTVRLRTHFSKEHNRFPSYFSFTAICFFSCFSLSCGFKHSDNSWHLIGHFCKKSIILIINKVVMPGQR